MAASLRSQVDRLVISAVDVVDGERAAGESAEHRRPVEAALHHLLVTARRDRMPEAERLRLIVHRLARWTTRANHVLSHSPSGAGTDDVAESWHGWVARSEAELADLVWATATAAADVVAERRSRWRGFDDALTGTLRVLCPPLPSGERQDPWVLSPVSGRPTRYDLRAALEPGSATMLWAGNDAARSRWARAVDHFDLPIPWELAERIGHLLERYDDATAPGLRGEPRPWNEGERVRFGQEVQAVCDELRRVLGSAYAVTAPDEP